MERTTIVAEERTLHRLREIARSRGVSFGAVVREALEEKVEREAPPVTFLGLDTTPPEARSAREADEHDLFEPDDFRGR